MMHHSLDPYPIPKEESPMYINEPWLIDKSLSEEKTRREPEDEKDNLRIYVPIDLNKKAIMRRLWRIISHYEEASEENESDFRLDVDMLVSQIEIYDQRWHVRHMPKEGKHSLEAIELVREFVKELEQIPDACAECFPFETIDELKAEYLTD